MNKSELITSMAEKSNLTKKDADAALNAFLESVITCISEGEKLQLVGFGTFERKESKARVGRNPKTGEPLNIEAKLSPKFKPSKEFKEKVNK